MKSRSDGARRNAEQIGDLRWGVSDEVVQYEDRALVRREPSEAALQLVAVRHAEQVVRSDRGIEWQDAEIGGATTFTRRLGDAYVRQKAMDPGVEPVRIAEARKVTPGDHQRILQGILGPIDIPEDPMRDREEAVTPEPDQVDECRLVTALCRFDEVAIHPHHPWGDVHRGRRPSLLVDARYRALERASCERDGWAQYPRARRQGHWTEAGMEFYPWFVFAHLAGLVLFAISHGASTFMAFRLRGTRDRQTVTALLEVGSMSLGPMYIGLALLIVGGLGAAWTANLWGQPWIIASIVVFIVVLVTMWAVASPYYMNLRKGLTEAGPDGNPIMSDEGLATQLDSRRPEILLAVGTIGLLLLVWLMVIKPGV